MKSLKVEPIKIILVVAFVLVLLAVTGLVGYQAGKGQAIVQGAESVSSVFVDLNADGKLDLLVSGAAIYNIPLSPTPQPTKPAKQ